MVIETSSGFEGYMFHLNIGNEDEQSVIVDNTTINYQGMSNAMEITMTSETEYWIP